MTFEEPPEPGLLPDLFSVLFAVGFLILGLLLIRGFPPDLFAAVVGQVEKSPVLLTVLGFVAIVVSAIILVIIAITIVGLPPIALVAGMLFIVA